jgi:hypothetical protein
LEIEGRFRLTCQNDDLQTVLNTGKKLVCFGAGRMLQNICTEHREKDFAGKIYRLLDNKATSFVWERNNYPVYSLRQFLAEEKDLEQVTLLITCSAYLEVFEQLRRVPQMKNIDCYIYPLVCLNPPPYAMPPHASGAVPKIPKKIHYMWFGGGPIPDKNRRWMESWKRHCPDYEIIRWDESNYDITKNKYMHDAYKEKKWGFVPDYARLDILYEHGGVYLDVDVEVLANLDILLYDEAFCGFERLVNVNFGLGAGAVKGSPIIKELRDYYERLSFYQKDGTLDLTTSCYHQTAVLREKGLLSDNSSWQIIEGMRVYPMDVFSPFDNIGNPVAYTKNTLTAHHYEASWMEGGRMDWYRDRRQRHRELWSRGYLGETAVI